MSTMKVTRGIIGIHLEGTMGGPLLKIYSEPTSTAEGGVTTLKLMEETLEMSTTEFLRLWKEMLTRPRTETEITNAVRKHGHQLEVRTLDEKETEVSIHGFIHAPRTRGKVLGAVTGIYRRKELEQALELIEQNR